MASRGGILAACLLLAAGTATADWTASGSFHYVDREYDQTGFTGDQPSLPVRFADLEIVDANASGKNAVLATGATAADGSYSIFVSDSRTRSVYVRVITRSNATPDLHISVEETVSSKPRYYAAALPTLSGHAPTVNVDFGAAEILPGQGGEAFNLYDQMVRGADYIAALTGSRPGSNRHLATIWSPTNGVGGSYYDLLIRSIRLRDTAGYDDTVVLHEMGHYAIREYSATDSPGGAHTFAWCVIDLRLAFDEGFASFWGNSALRHHGAARSNVYMRSNGGPGPGNVLRWADLEDDRQFFCRGATSEVNVFTVLWDIVDGASTPDTTPGVDDAHDQLELPDSEIWEVMTGPLPGASNISFEDFWDAWFLPPVTNGFVPEMIAIAGHVAIEMSEDSMEANDDPGLAASVVANGLPLHATFFRDADGDGAGGPQDLDVYAFTAAAAELYTIETLDLLGACPSNRFHIDTGVRV